MSGLGTPRADCDHPDRYHSLGGKELCDTCAKLDEGWKYCPAFVNPPCGTLISPAEDGCERHRGAITAELLGVVDV